MNNSIIYLGIDVHSTNYTFCALSVTLGEAPKVIAENQTEADDHLYQLQFPIQNRLPDHM